MKKCFFVVILILLAIPVFGQGVGPNQVIIFEHNDFVGKSKPFTLEPGMRHKLVPKLGNFNDKVSSILVGKNVKVWVYKHADFKGITTYIAASAKKLSKHNWIFIAKNATVILEEDINDKVSSMIIFPRHRIHPVGINLSGKGTQFFPLPENKTEDKAMFPDLTDYMNDKADELDLYGNVVVTVYKHNDFKEPSLKFPGAGPSQDKSHYYLGTYQFKNKISSLIVQGVGDEVFKMKPATVITPQKTPEKDSDAELAMAPHEAKVITPQQTQEMKGADTGSETTPQMGEAISSEPRFDLFEKIEGDTDRPGNNYRNFDLEQPDMDFCLQACQNDPRCKAFTYVKPGLQGPKARCWLKDAVPGAKPLPGCISGVKK